MEKIMLVDDLASDLSKLSGILSEKHEVLQAGSAGAAIKALEGSSNVSVLIISAYLADDTGFSLLTQLRNDINVINIPVLFIVRQSDHKTAHRALDMGADDCITIPFCPPLIIRSVENVIKLSKAGSAAAGYYKDMLFARQLVEDFSTAVCVCDTDTYELLYANKSCARLRGTDQGSACGMKCYEFLRGRQKPCSPCLIDCANPSRYTERKYFNEKTGRHFLTRGKLIDYGGRNALVQYFNDETDKVNAQVNLIDLLDQLPTGLGMVYLYPDYQVEVAYLNSAFYQLLGEDRQEHEKLSGDRLLSAVHPDDMEKLKLDLSSAVRENTAVTTELRAKCASGEYIRLSSRSSFVYTADNAAVFYTAFSLCK